MSPEVHKHFRLFLHSTRTNLHLRPEHQACVTALDFTITPASLEEQLLRTLISRERPDLHAQHERWTTELSGHERQLKAKEDAVLDSLAASEGGFILEDTTAVTRLTEAKTLWSEIRAARGAAQRV